MTAYGGYAVPVHPPAVLPASRDHQPCPCSTTAVTCPCSTTALRRPGCRRPQPPHPHPPQKWLPSSKLAVTGAVVYSPAHYNNVYDYIIIMYMTSYIHSPPATARSLQGQTRPCRSQTDATSHDRQNSTAGWRRLTGENTWQTKTCNTLLSVRVCAYRGDCVGGCGSGGVLLQGLSRGGG